MGKDPGIYLWEEVRRSDQKDLKCFSQTKMQLTGRHASLFNYGVYIFIGPQQMELMYVLAECNAAGGPMDHSVAH